MKEESEEGREGQQGTETEGNMGKGEGGGKVHLVL